MNNHIPFGELETLIAHQGKPAVSIYLPTTRIPTRVQAETLQFKNLIREAEEQLAQFEMRGPDVRAILEPARQLITDSDFWRHPQDGMAVFLAEDIFFRYQLPISFRTELIVSEVFHLKPLVPILSNEFVFYILAVSQNQVRLLRASRFEVEELDPATIPSSLQEVLSEYEIEKQVQYRTSGTAQSAGRGGGFYWGQGAGATVDDKAKIREFFDRIDRGLRDFFQDQNAPLVFAGVEYLFPIYREANTYTNLVESSITGNPEELQPNDLHRRAWRLIEPLLTAKRVADIELYHRSFSHNLTSTKIAELVPWADKGRVQIAFVDKQAVKWGQYDPGQFEAIIQDERQPGDRDLTDLVAIYTLLRGGEVYLLTPEEMEMEFGPDNRHRSSDGISQNTTARATVAAIYRYAV
jgi:hypothetical protein